MRFPITIIAAGLLSGCGGGTARDGVIPYPLTTCIVTDNALGSMGDEQRIVHDGREIKFCCEPCVAKFQADPAKYLAKLPAR